MARTPVVSRTVKSTLAKVLAYNLETKEVSEIDVTLPRVFSGESMVLKYLQKNNENKTVEYVRVVGMITVDEKYVMTVEDFVSHAMSMDEYKAKFKDTPIAE